MPGEKHGRWRRHCMCPYGPLVQDCKRGCKVAMAGTSYPDPADADGGFPDDSRTADGEGSGGQPEAMEGEENGGDGGESSGGAQEPGHEQEPEREPEQPPEEKEETDPVDKGA